MVRMRIHLIPPDVLPAQPPTIVIKATKTHVEGSQFIKFSVVKPVVDCIDMVWKNERRAASANVR